MAGKEIAVKKYVVKLSAEERDRLEALIHAGMSPAQLLTRSRRFRCKTSMFGEFRYDRRRIRAGRDIAMGRRNCFKGRQFTAEVILWVVRWYRGI